MEAWPVEAWPVRCRRRGCRNGAGYVLRHCGTGEVVEAWCIFHAYRSAFFNPAGVQPARGAKGATAWLT